MLIFVHIIMGEMKISKQLKKIKNLNVKAENCLTRKKAKEIIRESIKIQNKIQSKIKL